MRVKFVNLGCSKNLVDSERMAGILRGGGITITEDEKRADALVINTCAFIENARMEAIETILAGGEWKKRKKTRRMFVVGCMPQRYPEEMLVELPEADGFFGVGDYRGLVSAILAGGKEIPFNSDRYAFTPAHYRYLRIADGCDRTCSYCAIPLIRGRYKSRPVRELVEETEALAESGAKEIILTAQEINSYGSDLGDGSYLIGLLKELSNVGGIEWIRMLYLHPPLVKKDFLEYIAGEDKICPYFDFPIEHINDGVLKRMGRRIDRKTIVEKLRQIREIVPGAAIRTSIMTGFPGESDEAFDELADFVGEGWFDHLGVFTYSPEEGTGAYNFKELIPDDMALFRLETIMEIQRDVSLSRNEGKVGSVQKVLVDGLTEENQLHGRTMQLAPEVDGIIYLEGEAKAGEFAEVEITAASDYDLYGKVMGK